jgi:hypothetical protein
MIDLCGRGITITRALTDLTPRFWFASDINVDAARVLKKHVVGCVRCHTGVRFS